MYFESNTDGIPVLSQRENDVTVRKATRQEINLYNDFWVEYNNKLDQGFPDNDTTDEETRREVLHRHGLDHLI